MTLNGRRDPNEPRRKEKETLQTRLAELLFQFWEEQKVRFVAHMTEDVGLPLKGGPGSGHFGHVGRPGQRGGSQPGSGRNLPFHPPEEFGPDTDPFDQTEETWVIWGVINSRVYVESRASMIEEEDLGDWSHSELADLQGHNEEDFDARGYAAPFLADRYGHGVGVVVYTHTLGDTETALQHYSTIVDKSLGAMGEKFKDDLVVLYASDNTGWSGTRLTPKQLEEFKARKAYFNPLDMFWSAEHRLLVGILLPVLTRGAQGSVEEAADELQVYGSFGIDWLQPHEAALNWAIFRADVLARELNSTTSKALDRHLAEFISTPGATVGALADSLFEVYGSDSRALRAAITEITEVYAEGSLRAWGAMGPYLPGLEIFKVWHTNEDDFVCDICGGVNGQERLLHEDFSNGLSRPPGHIGCRCWLGRVVRPIKAVKGGPGSGHFGHVGRPGRRGGSQPGRGGGGLPKPQASGLDSKGRRKARDIRDDYNEGLISREEALIQMDALGADAAYQEKLLGSEGWEAAELKEPVISGQSRKTKSKEVIESRRARVASKFEADIAKREEIKAEQKEVSHALESQRNHLRRKYGAEHREPDPYAGGTEEWHEWRENRTKFVESHPSMKRLKDRQAQLGAERLGVNLKLGSDRQQAAFLEEFGLDSSEAMRFSHHWDMGKKARKKREEGALEGQAYLNQIVASESSGIHGMTLGLTAKRGASSDHNTGKRTMGIGVNAGSTGAHYIHEYGHELDDRIAGQLQSNVDFAISRGVPDPPSGYIGRRSKTAFPFPAGQGGYSAVLYYGNVPGFTATDPRTGNKIYGSEVLSVGLECLYKMPGEFAAEDPEYFNFILDSIQGAP